jgi:hypothetical protein
MQLTFAKPDRLLASVIGTYYLIETDQILVEDAQRADLGQVRLILQGSGHVHDGSGLSFPTSEAILSGPSVQSSKTMIHGPARILCASILPHGWGGLIGMDARTLLNQSIDAGTIFPNPSRPLIEALITKPDVKSMASLLDAFFQPMLKPLPKGHQAAIEAIRVWLSSTTYPEVDALYASWPQSERQMTRIANRYWGAAPKALSNKYGALRTALGIVQNNGQPTAEANRHYSDRPHLIRAVKRATGQTPSQLRSTANPLLRMSLFLENYRELDPPVL